jgi:hypothetical protein
MNHVNTGAAVNIAAATCCVNPLLREPAAV